MRFPRRFLCQVSIFAAASMIGAGALLAQAPEAKRPVPSADQQKEAVDRVRELFQEEYQQAKSPEQKALLVEKLLDKARETTNDPTARFVLLASARDLAVQSGHADLAMRAIDEVAEAYAVDALAAKCQAVGKLARSATSTKQLAALATVADDLIDDACAADKFEEASELARTARDAARDGKDRELLKQVVAHGKQIEASVRAYEQVKSAMATLEEKPADPEANLAVGKHLCFVKGDWEKGVTMLALGSDESLRKAARKDLEGAADAEGQAALGDAWWKLAEEAEGATKRLLQARAEHWYRPAFPQLSGLSRDTVGKRLADLDQAKAAAPVSRESPGAAKRMEGTFVVRATQRKTGEKKVSVWEFRYDRSLIENDAVVGTWNAGDAQVTVKFSDEARAGATIRMKKKDLFLGTISFQSGDAWNCELHRVWVVAVWQHYAGNRRPRQITFWSNGCVDRPNGDATWSQKGSKLTLRWPNGAVDNCTLSPDGRSYEGKGQRGTPLRGTLVSGQ